MQNEPRLEVVSYKGTDFNVMALPGSKTFRFEITSNTGADAEKFFSNKEKSFYGLAHLAEHLSFKNTLDYKTDDLMTIIKSEGQYNAGTNHDKILYWFLTETKRMELAIKLVCNYAFNDLSRVSEEEFRLEKDVVMNEIRRYGDDAQGMFYSAAQSTLCGYHEEDNILGLPETIDKSTLEDLKKLKEKIMSTGVYYNIAYDPDEVTVEEVLEKVVLEISRHKEADSKLLENISKKWLESILKERTEGEHKIVNDSDQFMTYLSIPFEEEVFLGDLIADYVKNYAEEASLDHLIREKNGLTYGVHFWNEKYNNGKQAINFACDVTRGTEAKLMTLFKESVKKCSELFDERAYDSLLEKVMLRDKLDLLDTTEHYRWFSELNHSPSSFKEIAEVAKHSLLEARSEVYKKFSSYKNMKKALKELYKKVQYEHYGIMTNG